MPRDPRSVVTSTLVLASERFPGAATYVDILTFGWAASAPVVLEGGSFFARTGWVVNSDRSSDLRRSVVSRWRATASMPLDWR